MYRESTETLEDKIDFLIDLLTDEQYTQYAEWCEEQGYWTEGGV